MSFKADNSSLQNQQNKSNVQHQYRSNFSDRQNESLTFNFHPGQVQTQPFDDHQDMSGLSASSNGLPAARQSHQTRQCLEVKPNYSYDEVKALVSNVTEHAQKWRAKITSLESVNSALVKNSETLQRQQLDMLRQIQHHEHTITQKDRLLKALHEKDCSLQQSYKQVRDDQLRLIAALRKGNGTGNPSAIARSIRWNHASNPMTAASQGCQSSVNASPMHPTKSVQPYISGHGSEQTFACDQESVQPVSIPSSSAVTAPEISSWSLHPQGYAVANYKNANPLQSATIPASSEIDVAEASSPALRQPESVNAKHDGTSSQHDQLTHWAHSSQSLDATIGATTTNSHNNNYAMGQELKERLTIDLTDDAQPPSSLFPHDQSLHETRQKTFSWLQGENPFKRGTRENPYKTWIMTQQRTEIPNPRQPSESNAEERIALAESPAGGRAALPPQTAIDRKTKEKPPKKAKVVLSAEAKKERAKGYRKTAAEKKRRDSEIAHQSLQRETMSNDHMRAQKGDRRAAKGEQRQKQARQALGEVGQQEPQKTLDGRLYQENIGVRQDVHQGSREYDHDSLFGDDEDDSLEMKELKASSGVDSAMYEEDAVVEEDRDAAFVAEVEAAFAADADAERRRREIEGNAALGDDDGYHDFSSNGEESEEE